jgi:hypothetical protein
MGFSAFGLVPGRCQQHCRADLGSFAKNSAVNRHIDNGAQVQRTAGLAMKRKPSVDFSGYWQKHIAN